MPRFVVLEHDHPVLHWDLMLETNGVLRTWRLAAPPQVGSSITATAVFDHRLHYLEYEGPISGDRGRVIRWDLGIYFELPCENERIIVHLRGERLQSILNLTWKEGVQWCSEFCADADNK